MSLKSFHVVFIVSAFLLAVFLGVWSLRQYIAGSRQIADLVMGVLSVAGALILVVYGKYFVRKLRNIDYF